MPPEKNNDIEELKKQIIEINNKLSASNFSAYQEFSKSSNFSTRLKIPHYEVNPTTCETGEIIEVGGKLKICSATNTWVIVGSQS